MVPHIEQANPAIPAVLMYVAYQACKIICMPFSLMLIAALMSLSCIVYEHGEFHGS